MSTTIRSRYIRTINGLKGCLIELATVMPNLDLKSVSNYEAALEHDLEAIKSLEEAEEQLMNNYTQASDGPDEVLEQAQRTIKSIRQRKQARHVRCETLPTLPSTSRASSEPQTNLAQGIAETNMPLLNSTQAIQPTPAVVLSKITLPTFTGETFDWKRFYQLFMTSKRNIKLNPRQGNIFKNSIKMITKGRPTRGRESPEKCQYCDGGHNSRDCTKFETPQRSSTRARERRLCFNCLR
uniref:CCHC-type domain-containing protein n=1 Tax=Heterorhabditis bacteriophora TaxID=37862 RepID=A0A1I7W6B2_HETBA